MRMSVLQKWWPSSSRTNKRKGKAVKLKHLMSTICKGRNCFFFHQLFDHFASHLSHISLCIPHWWVNDSTLTEFCFSMTGRADIRIKNKRRYERLAATSQLSLWMVIEPCELKSLFTLSQKSCSKWWHEAWSRESWVGRFELGRSILHVWCIYEHRKGARKEKPWWNKSQLCTNQVLYWARHLELNACDRGITSFKRAQICMCIH